MDSITRNSRRRFIGLSAASMAALTGACSRTADTPAAPSASSAGAGASATQELLNAQICRSGVGPASSRGLRPYIVPTGAKIVRKNAAAMTADEIDRFKRAFDYALANGYIDTFNDEHNDHKKHNHHGADVLPTSPMAAELGTTSRPRTGCCRGIARSLSNSR